MDKGSSLKDRFVFKLAGNGVAVLLGLVAMLVVPRALGPANFGRFEFITYNFKLILDTFTFQIPMAFFTWVSRKGHKDNIDFSGALTLCLSVIVIILFGLFIWITIMFRYSTWLWPDIQAVFLWQAFGFAVMMFFYQFFIYLSDGKALTIGLEKIRLFHNIIKTVSFVIMFWIGVMNLHSYFIAQNVIISIIVIFSAAWLHGKGAYSIRMFKIWSFNRSEFHNYWSFVKKFASPLVILMFFGFVFLYFDRWFLQIIGGSSEQGFFGLSERLGAIAFIFTSAMTPLLSREFALAYEENDHARLTQLFERIKIFLFIAAVTSCFLSVQSPAIAQIAGGDKFKGAIIPISIMALYPIHQTFGQLSASLLIATGQTGLYSRIGIMCMVASLPLTYFLMAPQNYLIPGLALGATGLAIKMVIINIIGTNIQLYFNVKYLSISFKKWLLIQVKIVLIIYGIACLASVSAGYIQAHISSLLINIVTINTNAVESLFKIIISGIIYLSAIFMLVFKMPELAGIDKNELVKLVSQISAKLHNQPLPTGRNSE